MPTFKLRPDAFAKLRKAMLFRRIPIVLLALGGGLLLPQLTRHGHAAQSDNSFYLFIIPVLAIVGGFTVRKVLKRQRIAYESFLLTIEEDAVTRSIIGYPLIRIPREEIRAIERTSNAFVIKGNEQLSPIYVPPHIDDPDQVEQLLARFVPVQRLEVKKHWKLAHPLVVLVGVAGLLGIVGASSKWLVALSALAFFPMMIWGLVVIFRSKNVESRARTSGIVIIVMLIAMTAITVFKLTAAPPIDALVAYISRLTPETTPIHLEKIACNDRITLPIDQQPHILWASTDPGSLDGALVHVFAAGSTGPTDRPTYFHWEPEDELFLLFQGEDSVVDHTAITWHTLLNKLTSVHIFNRDHALFAKVEFGAWHDEGSGAERDAVTYYRRFDGELYEYSESFSTPMPKGDPCLTEDPRALDAWLSEIGTGRIGIGAMEYGPSEAGQDPIIQQFLDAAR